MKGLVLAEKPSLMRAIQSAYRHDRFSFQLDFASFHGHLMELAEPGDYNPTWARWTLEALPMIPEHFCYLPQDRRGVSALLRTIRSGGYDFLVNACDAGREGELIFWSFYEANGLTLPVARLWSSTTVEKDLQKALHDLRPASEFDNLRASSRFRAEFDWLVGMNFSRAISLKTGRTSNIGRVVTPTLKMVVDRELEIRAFVSQPFWEVSVPLEKDGMAFSATALVPPENRETRFPEKSAAEGILSAIGAEGVVESVACRRRSTPAPTLYSTLTLQKDASRYFRFRASRTDSLAQDLYEAGFISYPRTECRFLPTSLVPEIPRLLKSLEKLPALEPALRQVTPEAVRTATRGRRYVDDSRLTDHHAIIPTTADLNPDTLSPDHRRLYELIAKRFLSIFLPPYVVDSTVAVIDSNGVKLKAVGRVVVQKGFSVLYQDTSRETPLPSLCRGEKVRAGTPRLKEGKTAPPDRYTEETLLDAMANAGRFVSAAEQRAILKETAGLGTGATRAGILQKLESTGMCRVEKKTYYPTEFGMQLIGTIGDRDISSPSLTAQWEGRLRDLEENGHPEVFQAAMLDYIRRETADLVEHIDTDLSAAGAVAFGTCPLCGGTVYATDRAYQCGNGRSQTSPCPFSLRKKAMGVTITDQDMKALLAGGPTRPKHLKFQSGKQLTAPLILSPTGKVTVALERMTSTAPR